MRKHNHTEHQHEAHQHHEHEGYNHHDHHKMMIKDFKKRFWVSSLLTIPVLLLSPMIQSWRGVNWTFNGDNYILNYI